MDEEGYATADELTVGREMPGEDYTIMTSAGTAQKVRIRALTRYEVLVGQKLADKGIDVIEAHMLSCAMVRPAMDERTARRWQKATPAGELEVMTRRIRTLSGMGAGADEAAYEQFRSGPDERVRALPSDEARPDSGGATPVDQ